MTRARLLLLATSTLLTTSFGATEPIREALSPADSPVASAAIAAPTAPAATAMSADDAALAEQILERLSARHTALSANDCRELAHTIVAEARAHRLDPDLVVAVIEVESAGYHLAVSHVGAMGLMQLLPSTAAELAGKLGIEWRGDDMLFDPMLNVKLGTAYLRELADRYGDVNMALAAYNWGPGRIDRRLRSGAGLPSRYIEQVMRSYDRNAARMPQRS